MEECVITSDGLKLRGILALPNSYSKGVIFLHGGGRSNSTRYEYLQHRLLDENIASIAFDMRGCGRSEGEFTESNLANRKRDTVQVANYFLKKLNLRSNQIYFWGSSMGGHIASSLANELNVKGIILQCPAAYGKDADYLALNEQFTQFLHKSRSWEDTVVFSELLKFKGRILVVYGENDQKIPDEIKNMYKNSLKKDDLYVTLVGGSHKLLSPSNEEEQKVLEKLADTALKFLT